MGLLTYSLPTIGDPNSTEDVDIRTALSDLKTLVNGQIDDANVNASSFIGGNAGIFKPIAVIPFATKGSVYTVNTYLPVSEGTFVSYTTYVGFANHGSGVVGPVRTFYLDSANYPTLGSKTAQLRVAASLSSETASNGTLEMGLYPLTISAGAYVIGTVVTSSTVTLTKTANTTTYQTSSNFAMPNSGLYTMALKTTVATTTEDFAINASLEYKYA